MAGFEKHYMAGNHQFPMVSLWLIVPVYMGTDDPTLVILTLVLGSVILRASAVVPDIDSHDSIPRRGLGRFLTVCVVGVFTLTVVDLVVPGQLLATLLSRLPLGVTPSVLLVLLLLWTGLASRHRSVTHSILWGIALSLAFGVTGFFLIFHGGTNAAATVGGALGVYSFVGFYTHISIDEEFKIRSAPDDRDFDSYKKYLGSWTGQFQWLTIPVVAGGIVVAESSLLLLTGLSLAYCGLIAGLTLPDIDWKRSEPRRVFDMAGTVVLAGLLLQQLLANRAHLLGQVEVGMLELPQGTTPAFYLLLLVLWLGREGNLLKRLGLYRVTHTLKWPAAVCTSLALLTATATSALPVQTRIYLAVSSTGPLLYGFYHHFRVDEIIVTPEPGGD